MMSAREQVRLVGWLVVVIVVVVGCGGSSRAHESMSGVDTVVGGMWIRVLVAELNEWVCCWGV